MRTIRQIRKESVFAVLDVIKFVLILVLVLMFIQFNSTAVRQAEETKKIAGSTNDIVKSQEDILTAIKQVTEDTRVTAQEQTSIIICMLQVPIGERSTDLQAKCRKAAEDAPTIPVSEDNNSETTGTGSAGPSSNRTPSDAQTQSFNSQNPATSTPTPTPTPSEPTPNFLERVENSVERTLSPVLTPINNLLNR